MSIYTYKINMACIDDDADEQAWALFAEIEKIVFQSMMQTNSHTLEKDGKDYPRSREAMMRQVAHELAEKKREAKRRVRIAREALLEAEKELLYLED